jgi:soluble lytic murein transglycosylase
MKMKTRIFYFLTVCVLLGSVQVGHANTLLQIHTQKRWFFFQEAYQALLKEDLKTYEQKLTQLSDYPIAHYLRYFYLKSHLGKEAPKNIQSFLNQYQKSPVAPLLRQAWLKHLAKKRDWKTFLEVYTPQTDTVLQCYYIRALLPKRKNELLIGPLLEQAKKLWLVGKSQPKACDPVFNYLYKNKLITKSLRWQRIRLAMRKRNFRLARFLAKGLSYTDRQLVRRWRNMHRSPARELKRFKHPDTPIAREILLDGLRQLAKKDANSAYDYWKDYQKRYAFNWKAKMKVFRYIALKGADQNFPEAARWLEEIDKTLVNDKVIQAKLQVVLAKQDWQAVTKLILSLPIAEQHKHQWQYWLARAVEEMDNHQGEAEKQFRKLSQHQDYYGFLAADRLGIPYSFQSQPLKVSDKSKAQLLKKYPGLSRARELYFVGLPNLARNEWQIVLPALTTEELKIAAALAHQWGWHDRAITTLAKVKNGHDFKIYFPVPFYDTVLTHAEHQLLDFAYVYAVIRQESLFQTDAISRSGALGLMQLMPGTALEVARKQRIRLNNLEDDLFVPEVNIRLGTAYLRQMLNRFQENHLLATAAYNAGPSRAKRWKKRYGCLSPDIWVELIPSTQTRKYVKHVMNYSPLFEHQMVGHKQVKPMPLDVIQIEGCPS